MRITSIRIRNFRNHSDTHLDFGDSINVLVGGNGEGKTNVLEAICYFGLGKSFYSAGDSIALKMGEEVFDLEGSIVSESGSPHQVAVRYDWRTGEKAIAINRVPLETIHAVIGKFPVVLLSHESGRIIYGSASERRKFLDVALSQQSRPYFEDLLEYRRVLKQRNRLLTHVGEGKRVTNEMLSPWTEGLVRIGSRIMRRRRNFVAQLCIPLTNAFRSLTGGREEVGVKYKSVPEIEADTSPEAIASALAEAATSWEPEELRRGISLVGPHRDEVVFTIDGLAVRPYASQGQQKTLLVALKIAEVEHHRSTGEDAPILLLDDLLGDLDQARSERMIAHISGLGQSIITATADTALRDFVSWNSHNRRFTVEKGTCKPC